MKNKKTREFNRNQTVQKNLSMSDMILKFSFITLNSNIEWTLQTLPKDRTNKSMEKYNLYLQSAGPP